MSANKSNELIQKASHDLNSIQLKFLNKVLELIDSEAKEFEQFYYIDLNSFIENDLEYESNKNLHNIIKNLKSMKDKGIEIVSEKAKELNEQQKDLILNMLNDDILSLKQITKYSKAPLYRVLNFLKTLDLSKKQKKEYKELEKIVDIPENDIIKTELYTGWLSSVETTSKNNIVRIEIPKAMEKYYLGLKDKGNYSKVNAELLYKLKSKYSIRLYELIYSHSFKKNKLKKSKKGIQEYENYIETSISYKKLKRILGVAHKYKDYRNFRRYVLDTAKKELKEKDTDIQFDFEASGRGEGKDIVFKIYNVKELREKEEQEKAKELLDLPDNIDKMQYDQVYNYIIANFNFKETKINELFSNYTLNELAQAIQYVDRYCQRNKVKNPSGLFLKTLKTKEWVEDDKQKVKDKIKKNKQKELPNVIDPEVKKEKDELSKQKEKLKTEMTLWFEFLAFLSKKAENKPGGYIASILPMLQINQELIDTEGKLDRFISMFFKISNK